MQMQFNINIRDGVLPGELSLPNDALGIVMFIHGSGSSRHSPRDKRIADTLNNARIGTLLFDLLTPGEEALDLRDGRYRFDIPFLARRVEAATYAIRENTTTQDLPIGYFGASTGAAAALVASTRHPNWIDAIVSRGGRPDLAGETLPFVKAPTLLIVGSNDVEVLGLNRMAYRQLQCRKAINIVDNATHLFEEPGALEQVATLAKCWFVDWFELARTPFAHTSG